MKVTKIEPVDAVWCMATTSKGKVHMTIEEAEKSFQKPVKKTGAKKSATKKA